jgi:futalosine hydrolase
MGVKCLQIRSISNYVELRNKENWNIPLAINNLNIELEKIINSL